MEEFIVSLFGIGLFAIIVIMVAISRLLLICHPNEVIILSGRKRRLADGNVVGYRIIRGGRAMRVPLIEKAARMSLETIPLDLSVFNAYSKGGIPLKVEAIANIKIDSSEPTFGNAVERFLGKRREEIHEIAKDTLEGNLRGVLATLTPEEVNEDRLKFASSLIEEADSDLKALGLQLDTLKIQNVSDEAGYLDSIGRRKTAEVLAQARTAEASRKSEAEQSEANAERMAEIAKASAKQEIEGARIEADRSILVTKARAQQEIETENNALRIKKAELEREAVIKENEALVAGEKARVVFEQEVEEQRIVLQQKRLTADVIEPARAKKEAMELEAKGAAASIVENGLANIHILNQMIATYKQADGDGEKIFVLNMLPDIIQQLVNTVGKMHIDKISVIDSGNGKSVAGLMGQLPNAVISLNEIIENATGVNILSGLQRDKLTDATRKLEESAG
ncbi:MAG TPA: SPFH domain-containing protein [Bacteroidota bacterium]|nr:SPFH domain-containing protein [Bacteroidota bacterium]